jgi:hypothetical protein
MLSVLMVLLDAALAQRVGRPHYTHGATTPTGAWRGSGSSNSWFPPGATGPRFLKVWMRV